MREELLEAIQRVFATGRRGALATVVRAKGSTPQRAGAQMVLHPDGTTFGTVGGGAFEQAVLETMRGALASGEPELLVKDLGHDLGMCCGGRMEVFVEPIEAAPRLWLCGAGHVAEAVSGLARGVGFRVHVVDDRDELNNPQRFPDCELELVEPPSLLRRIEMGAHDWVLIATHDHHLDERTLDAALTAAPRYIGMVGSRRKTLRLVQRIRARRGEVSMANVYAPVGLSLGAVGPHEIAISIVAELVALRRGHVADHMRMSLEPAHERTERRAPAAEEV